MATADSSRRDFLKTSASTAGAAGVLAAASQIVADAAKAATNSSSANAKIRIGFVDPGGRGQPNHIAGWNADDHGSVLEEPDDMKLAGPWIDGKDSGA